MTPLPTIEEVIWKTLRKARLISPVLGEGADESMDVMWGEEKRRKLYVQGGGSGGRIVGDVKGKKKLELNWEGCQYSKCGRTDRGVSAFGQVIGIRVRSNRPIEKRTVPEQEVPSQQENGNNGESLHGLASEEEEDDGMPTITTEDLSSSTHEKPFDPIRSELPYISLLNAILPPDIRILAWCPFPPPIFDARISCRERRYKYFFTNPAFCPTPGPRGFQRSDGKGQSERREGWLDVAKMKAAAKKLEGLHDFRNLCKIDASKQMGSCLRRITFADVVEWDGGAGAVTEHRGLNQFGDKANGVMESVLGQNGDLPEKQTGPKVYTFCVHGTAFLWHQVRCMVAVLFLIGQGLEEPSIIDELLDVQKNPGRPMYEMADDAPLVLWDCVFPDKEPKPGVEMVDSLDWLYAGDELTIPTLSTSTSKTDGKFGTGAVVDELWTQWREAKMREILTGSLLDLAISQGDQSSYQRKLAYDGATKTTGVRSQKVFDGSGRARIQGRYVPVMDKPRMDSLEVLNTRWLETRNARRALEEDDAREVEETNAEE